MVSPVKKDVKIVFEPDPTWAWEGWDGAIAISPQSQTGLIDGDPIIVENDIVTAARKLAGKMYKAVGFEDIPGAVSVAQVAVRELALSRLLTVDGQKGALNTTKGTFRVSVVPSFKQVGPVAVPDPLPLHSGRWHLDDSALLDWIESV